MKTRYDVIVLGAGPAGLTAAKGFADKGEKVLVLERNEIAAKKIYATGNGRCNFLNINADNAKEILEYCNSIGIVEVREEDRLYPRNKQASSVAFLLENAAKKAGAEIKNSCIIKSVQKNEHDFVVESETKEIFYSDKLVIATGGKAGIQYGCYGDGYKWAYGFGHNVIKPIPALTGFECAEDISLLAGVRTHALAKLFSVENGKECFIAQDEGEVQFTKDAISGICVMNLSRYFRIKEGTSYCLSLDLYPEYSEKELLDLFHIQIKRAGCAMEGLVPEKLHDYLHTRINKNEHNPSTMASLSKDLRFKITGSKGWKTAQVSCGGVDFSELKDNYESKSVQGLYFAGEILNYDGPCGGYNIAFAIKSGMLVSGMLKV